ncbi:MAG TPA: AI-2E family transporter [Steroidobacteraceae bacterium]|jgi:predicted PurR-regulated permease PerM
MHSEGPVGGRATSIPFHVSQLGACKLLALGGFGLLLYFAHYAFIPIALALLLALVLSGPVEALYKRGVPRSFSALVILAVAFGLIGALAMSLWKPAQYWYSEAPQTIRAIKQKIAPAAKIVNRVDDIGNSAGSIANPAPGHSGRGAPPPPASSAASNIIGSSLGAVVSTATFAILTLFLLTGGPPMLARMTAAFADNLNASHVLKIIEAVRHEVGRFYAVTAMINIGLGVVTTVAMALWGMPTPYVWGIMAALLNFIPYAGPVTTLAIVTFAAAISFDTLAHVLGVAGTYLAITTIEGQIIQPLFVGRRLKINPLLIFLGLWLGGLFWGVAGVMLATPVLVALKVIAEHISGGRAILEFLGPNTGASATKKSLEKLVRADATR